MTSVEQTSAGPCIAVDTLSQDIQSKSRRVRYLVRAIDQASEPILSDSKETQDSIDMILQFCEMAGEQLLELESMAESIERQAANYPVKA